MKNVALYIILSIACLSPHESFANEEMRFSHITSENGLMQSHITCILQDDRDLVWFGTRNGLCRYNGYSFQTFFHKQGDSKSLPDNFVHAIFQDRNGDVWVGTDKGVCRYNYSTNDFSVFSGASGPINSIVQAKNGKLYFASDYLYCIDGNSSSLVAMRYSNGSHIRGAQTLMVDKKGLLWMAGKFGVWCVDSHMKKVRTIDVGKNDGNYFTISLFQDRRGNIWLGKNGGGLVCEDAVTRKLTYLVQPGDINENIVRAISEDNLGRMWVGTEKGLIIIYPNGKTEKVRQDFNNSFSLSDNAIYSILCDKQGNMWIGTYFGGANLYTQNLPHMKYIGAGSKINQLKGKAVRQIVEEHGKALWISTEDGGLNRLDYSNGIIEQANISGLSSNIHSLQIDKENNLWIGSFMSGLTCYNLMSGKTRHWTRNNSELPENSIFSLYVDKDNDLWIGTTLGLCCRKSKDDKIFKISKRFLEDSFIYSIVGDKNGTIWLGTRHKGLIKYNKYTGKLKHYAAQSKDGCLKDDFISCLFVDSKGTLWIGTNNGGLFRYDNKNDRFYSYLQNDKLNENCIYGIAESKNDRIWVSAGRNVYCHTKGTGRFIPIPRSEIMPLNHFNYNSAFADEGGRLFFGSVNGLISFVPDEMNYSAVFPKIQLMGITDSNGIQHYVDALKEISLSSSEGKMISIDFAAINPSHTMNVVYAVKMEGIDDHWQEISGQNKINYSNIPAGTYRFCVMASSYTGQWDEKNAKSIEVVIRPPLYATWWAKGLYFTLISITLFFLLKYYRKRQQEKREAFVVRLEKDKLVKLNQLKKEFFTDISHEIKTPLSLIVAPIRQMLENKQEIPHHFQVQLNTMLKGAESLRTLVQELIDVNQLNKTGYELTMVRANPLSHISDIAFRFQSIADDKNISFNTEIENWGEEATYSVVALEKIVNNLLSNAFKFTPKDGTVEIAASLINKQDTNARFLQIIVADNGCGMSEEETKHIFEKFYQVNGGNEKKQGWGIGLSVVATLVEAHRGSIAVESTPGKGSTFTVLLDVVNSVSTNFDKTQPTLLMFEQSFVEDVSSASNESSKHSVLIVEDNADMRNYLSDLFMKEYNVKVCSNGVEAIKMLQNGQLPDFILSDVMMPAMSGTELCKSIKQDPITAHIPIILLTAKTGTENALKGYEIGADVYMEKPFNPSVLLMQVKNLLNTREYNRKQFRESEYKGIEVVATNPYDKKLLIDIQQVVEGNISNSDFCVNDLAAMVGVSRTKLHLKLKSLINMSVGEYIKEMRIRKSKELLKKGYSISETAYATGFSEPNYFTKCFKKSTGLLPRDFIKENNKL